MPANPLSAFEREEIRAGIESGLRDHEIAALLGRHRCTINAEINRNGGRDRYRATEAQERARTRRRRLTVPKLVADCDLAAHVAKRLKARDSPMTISIELARGVHGIKATISHECIYQGVYANGERGLPAGIQAGLHLKRRRRKHRNRATPPCTHSLGTFNPISTRPAIAAQRVEVGHLEGDLIVGAYNRSALITIFDRASRHFWSARPANKTADATYTALTKLLKRIPEHLRRTLTWDQGAEIACHDKIAEVCRIKVYIADAKSPWQRPTNENGNALVRRYVGKGTNLNIYTPKDLRAIEDRINTIPRRSLGWATARDIYTAAVAMTD